MKIFRGFEHFTHFSWSWKMPACLFILVVVPSRLPAQGTLIDLVGQYDTPGAANGVFVRGDYAYVVTEAPGNLFIINVSQPSNPQLTGGVLLYGDGNAIVVQGDYAYVVTGSNELVYDLSDPANPVLVGSYDTYVVEGRGIYVSGSLAYVAHGRIWTYGREGQFRIFNVSDPGSPSGISEIFFGVNFVYDVYVVGDVTAYLAIDTLGIEIWDVTTPAAPDSLGSLDTPGTAYGIQVVGDIAYVADGLSGLRLIDISNPTAPAEVGFYDTPGTAQDVYVQGELAYLADGVSGIRVFDVRDPANPDTVGFYNTPGDARDIFFANDLIYVADGSPGLAIFRRRTATVTFPANATSIIALETTSLTGLGVQSFQFKLSYPDSLIDSALAFSDPTLGGQDWELQWNAVPGTLSVAAAGSDTLSGAGSLVGLMFYRGQNVLPGVQAPVRFEDFLFNEGDPLAFAIDGTIILRFGYGDVTENGAITAYDATRIFEFLLDGTSLSPVQQKKAEVSADSSITALDASLILQFVVGRIDSFPIEFPTPQLFPVTGELLIEDLAAAPGDTVLLAVELANGMGLYSGSLGLAFDPSVLEVLDIRPGDLIVGALAEFRLQPGEARLLFALPEQTPPNGTLFEVVFHVKTEVPGGSQVLLKNIQLNEGPLLAVGDSSRIVTVISGLSEPLSLPTEFVLLPNYPNPFNPGTTINFSLPHDADVRLAVFDLRGRELALLIDSGFQSGYHQVVWDGKDQAGRAMSTGIYIARLVMPEYSKSIKMLLLK